jgi:hypothetical protein
MKVKTLAEQLFFSTVRIDMVSPSGGHGSGTGFFFSHTLKSGESYLFLVTNKHVVMGMREGRLSFLKKKDDLPTLGDALHLKIGPQEWPHLWFGHPSQDIDIAICPAVPFIELAKREHGAELFFRHVGTTIIPNEQQLSELDAIEPVTFIGYPNGIWDTINFLPVARRGTTATPIVVDFEQTPRFLIDASVFGGSSGSPVFLIDQNTIVKDGRVIFSSRFYFVGVIAAVFFRTQENEVISVPIPTQTQPIVQQQEMIDLGIVFKARTVVETIEAYLKINGVDIPQPHPAPSDPVPLA